MRTLKWFAVLFLLVAFVAMMRFAFRGHKETAPVIAPNGLVLENKHEARWNVNQQTIRFKTAEDSTDSSNENKNMLSVQVTGKPDQNSFMIGKFQFELHPGDKVSTSKDGDTMTVEFRQAQPRQFQLFGGDCELAPVSLLIAKTQNKMQGKLIKPCVIGGPNTRTTITGSAEINADNGHILSVDSLRPDGIRVQIGKRELKLQSVHFNEHADVIAQDLNSPKN